MNDDAHTLDIRPGISRMPRREDRATTTPRMRRLEQLFIAALDLPTVQRAPFLEQEFGGDDELRLELDELLAAACQSTMGPREPSRMALKGIRESQPGCSTTDWARP